MVRTATLLLTLLLVGAFVSADARAVSESGTMIRNRAEISWFDPESGTVMRTLSNASTVTVASVHRFALDGPDASTAHAAKFLGLSYRIMNTGNVADRYTLSVADLVGDAGELEGLRVYHDMNGNGIADPGEPVLDETPLVPPGSLIELVVAGSVPNTALEGERYALELRAENGDGEARSSTTTINIVDGAFLAIDKVSTVDCATGISPGSDIDYRIDFTNSGNREPEARTHVIDGVARDGVLVVDHIPSGTRLLPDQQLAFAPVQGVPIVQGRAGEGEWTSYARWNGTNPARRLALFVPAENLGPGRSGRFEFSLHAVEFALPGAVVENIAGVDIDGDGRDEFVSDPVCNRIFTNEPELGAATSATIEFVEPVLEIRRAGETPDFSADTDWVEAGSFSLDTGRREYDVVRDGLYLELRASGLPEGTFIGEDGRGGTFIVVKLESLDTGDSLQVVLLETEPGSAIFRSVRPIALGTTTRGNGAYCPGGAALPLDPQPDYAEPAPECTLRSGPDDALRVAFGDAGLGVVLTDTVVVAPIAVVFDAYNLQPVAGATVTIRRGGASVLAAGVFADGADGEIVRDPLYGEPLVLVTDDRGIYEIPALPPGADYHVHVEPPASWLFPSEVDPSHLLGYDVVAASYGAMGIGGQSGVFEVVPGTATPLADIPLDPSDRGTRLGLDKRALQLEAEPGDVIAYALEVTNRSDEEQYNVRVADRLPFGFKLVAGTTRIDGELVEEPDGAPGTELDFALGLLEPGDTRELGYVLEATAGAIDSDGVNSARASARTISGVLLRSPESRARVRISRTGVLSERAALFGKVYIDADCNALQNDGEWPVGGIRLYLDDGTFAITDENGQFSLYGLVPGTHVLRADPLSVPEGLVFKPLDNANAATGDSRFVELSPGDFHRADFALSCPLENVDAVFEEIRERNATIDGSWLLEEAERFDPLEQRTDERDRLFAPDTSAADIDGDLSNGILNGPDAGSTRSEKRIEDEDEAEAANRARLVPEVAPATTPLDPKVAARTITAEQGKTGTWLWPDNDTSLDGRFVAVVRSGVVPTLFVNGQPVDEAQIGERIENRRERAQIVAWYGVRLMPGLNRVEVRGKDDFGNTRQLAKGEFKSPAMGTRMVLRARTDTLPADGGRSVLPIEINILDDNDYPAQGVHFVTLDTGEAGGGGWLEEDLQDAEPGHQVRVDDGRATVHLRSSDFTGTLVVRARANDMGADLRVFQVAALRPLFGVGLLEIGVVSTDLMSDGFAPTEQADELVDGTELDARLSMFLKGRVRGDAQLTLSYDSEKDGDTELLRDISPGAHYPIHGDASVRGYEAQSRSKLYAKLEKGKNSVMWGDYVTDIDSDVDDLARVQRVLTGFNSRFDTGRARFQLFAAESEEGRRSEEIPGNGTSLLFRLAGAPIVANSEIVELIVRDRENPGLVIDVQRLSRFGDYTIDSIGGELSFAEPVPSFDEALNPVFVRVSYDQESGGESYLVAGARARFALTESLVVGGSFTDDAGPMTGGTLGGAWVAWRPEESTTVTLGVAHATHADERAAGDAQRLAVEHRWSGERERRTALVAARAEEGFDSADASVGAGRRELRLEHRERFGATLRGVLEATHSESLTSEESRSTVGGTLDKSFERWSLRGGTRHIRQRDSGGSDEFTTAIVGAERRFEVGGRNASADVEYEQDVARGDRNRLGLGARVQAHEHAHVQARYERQSGIYDFSSFGGQSTTETFSLGVESDVIENTRLYSEYRMRGGIGGRDFATASGVRGTYELAPGLTLSPALEVVDTITGDTSGDGVALSIGATDSRNPNVRMTGQAEYRDGESANYLGLRGSYAARLNLDWSALAREDFRRQDPDEGEIDMRHAFTLGLARRPRLDNRHHMLFQYQWKVERADGEASDRDVHVLSTHQNFQVGPRFVLTGRLGGKRQTTFLIDRDHDTAAWLADARASWDIDRRWNLDLRAGVLVTGTAGRSRRHAFGVGLSHVLDRDLQLQLGYNVTGFRDEDLDPEGYDARGIRFGLRYKFDEKAFDWLDDR